MQATVRKLPATLDLFDWKQVHESSVISICSHPESPIAADSDSRLMDVHWLRQVADFLRSWQGQKMPPLKWCRLKLARHPKPQGICFFSPQISRNKKLWSSMVAEMPGTCTSFWSYWLSGSCGVDALGSWRLCFCVWFDQTANSSFLPRFSNAPGKGTLLLATGSMDGTAENLAVNMFVFTDATVVVLLSFQQGTDLGCQINGPQMYCQGAVVPEIESLLHSFMFI